MSISRISRAAAGVSLALMFLLGGCASSKPQEMSKSDCVQICEAVREGCHDGIKESVAEGTITEEHGKTGHQACDDAITDCLINCQ